MWLRFTQVALTVALSLAVSSVDEPCCFLMAGSLKRSDTISLGEGLCGAPVESRNALSGREREGSICRPPRSQFPSADARSTSNVPVTRRFR
jgi:hypothetical protein